MAVYSCPIGTDILGYSAFILSNAVTLDKTFEEKIRCVFVKQSAMSTLEIKQELHRFIDTEDDKATEKILQNGQILYGAVKVGPCDRRGRGRYQGRKIT